MVRDSKRWDEYKGIQENGEQKKHGCNLLEAPFASRWSRWCISLWYLWGVVAWKEIVYRLSQNVLISFPPYKRIPIKSLLWTRFVLIHVILMHKVDCSSVRILSLRFEMQLNCCIIHWILKEKCNPSFFICFTLSGTFNFCFLQYIHRVHRNAGWASSNAVGEQ